MAGFKTWHIQVYTASKNGMCDLAVRQIIDHEIEVSTSTGKERHTAYVTKLH